MSANKERPITIAILAVGGQGGGVLTQWLVELAEQNGYLAQSTFVAGVAQRTGATVYCVEMFPKDQIPDKNSPPVFTPYPVPGDVDVVIVGELAETGRAIQKGFVTPNATTLIASSHRLYSIAEKEAQGNGIFDQAPIVAAAAKAARKFFCFDMNSAANETGSVISSVMFGACAASGALPFERAAYEQTIRNTGRGVDASLRGFAAGFEGTTDELQLPAERAAMQAPVPQGRNGEKLREQILKELPSQLHDVALHGALRALEYQDLDYAEDYLARVNAMCAMDSEGNHYSLTVEVARQLALQMCYEDTIRVAELKTRAARFAEIREHVAAAADQPAHVVEYFHPRLEEVCDTLPASMGAKILASPQWRRALAPFFSKGRNVTTTNISGYLLMHCLAKLSRWRRGSYRFQAQFKLIDDWLDKVSEAIAEDYRYALAVAQSIEIVKGYGDTYHRGLTRYRESLAAVSRLQNADKAAVMKRLHDAALADEQGETFANTLKEIGA